MNVFEPFGTERRNRFQFDYGFRISELNLFRIFFCILNVISARPVYILLSISYEFSMQRRLEHLSEVQNVKVELFAMI